MGKHSGRHAFGKKIEEMGYKFDDEAFNILFKKFKALADQKKHIYDEDIISLIGQENISIDEKIFFHDLTIICGANVHQHAILKASVDDVVTEISARGCGPVDAIFTAIGMIYPHDAQLELYQVHAVTQGTDAQAKVTVRLSENGFTATGTFAHTDTMTASAQAYIQALNRLILRQKSHIE
jgi:2-isopropylmalate synthase